MQDADKAEVQHYHFQKKLDRLKASFCGSKLAIVRIFTSLLPIGALFLPIIKCTFTAPLPEKNGNLNAIDIYNMFGNIDFGALFGKIDGHTLPFIISAVLFLLSVVLIPVHLILLTLACSPKGKQRNFTLDIMMLVFAIGSAIAFLLSPKDSFAYGSLGVGSYLYILLLALNFIIEILIFKKGIKVQHKQCYVGGIPIEEYFKMLEDDIPHDEIRQEMYKRLSEMQAEKTKAAEEKHKAKSKKEAEVTENV